MLSVLFQYYHVRTRFTRRPISRNDNERTSITCGGGRGGALAGVRALQQYGESLKQMPRCIFACLRRAGGVLFGNCTKVENSIHDPDVRREVLGTSGIEEKSVHEIICINAISLPTEFLG